MVNVWWLSFGNQGLGFGGLVLMMSWLQNLE